MSREHRGLYDRAIFDHGEVQRRLAAGLYTRCPSRAGCAPLRFKTDIVEETIPPEWCASTEAAWFVVSTVPAKEYQVHGKLSRQGWSVWLPECVIVRKHKARQGIVSRAKGPLFPGYLFIRFDLDLAQWRMIEEADGVERVLRNGVFPYALPEHEVERLQRLSDADGGAIVIKAGMPRRQFLPDEPLRVIGGAFQGFEALYAGVAAKDRINILLDILGAPRVIPIPEALVEPA